MLAWGRGSQFANPTWAVLSTLSGSSLRAESVSESVWNITDIKLTRINVEKKSGSLLDGNELNLGRRKGAFFKSLSSLKLRQSSTVGSALASQKFCSLLIALCCAKSLQLCLTLCGPMDCSPLGSSVHGILQARISEWVAMPFSRGSSQPRDRTHGSYISCIHRRVL